MNENEGANPGKSATGAMPATLSRDFGIYSAFEQKLYRVGKDEHRGNGMFARPPTARPIGT